MTWASVIYGMLISIRKPIDPYMGAGPSICGEVVVDSRGSAVMMHMLNVLAGLRLLSRCVEVCAISLSGQLSVL